MYHTVLGTVSECAFSYLAVMTMLGWTASSHVEAYCSHVIKLPLEHSLTDRHLLNSLQ